MALTILGLTWAINCHAATKPEDLQALYKQAIASPIRTDDDRAADAKRKPLEFLEFADVRPGMRALDVVAGGGYTAQLLALVVGKNGMVWAQSAESSKVLMKRVSSGHQDNLKAVALPFENPVPEAATNLDLITIIMNYHDIAYMPVDRAKMNARLFAALKPGGHLVVLDHSAKAGSGIADIKTLHRIDEKVVIDEMQQAGFKLEKESDFLRNPGDPRDQAFFNTTIQTDKFALRFVKPAALPKS
ncbi:MAG: class I SAM-dependent methyltransferase [Nitrosomonadales bacterium]|nr:class I SAM-dependent methyltransferase [Nitrosomonadales bacterium]